MTLFVLVIVQCVNTQVFGHICLNGSVNIFHFYVRESIVSIIGN